MAIASITTRPHVRRAVVALVLVRALAQVREITQAA